jgi:hypothetical protein
MKWAVRFWLAAAVVEAKAKMKKRRLIHLVSCTT